MTSQSERGVIKTQRPFAQSASRASPFQVCVIRAFPGPCHKAHRGRGAGRTSLVPQGRICLQPAQERRTSYAVTRADPPLLLAHDALRPTSAVSRGQPSRVSVKTTVLAESVDLIPRRPRIGDKPGAPWRWRGSAARPRRGRGAPGLPAVAGWRHGLARWSEWRPEKPIRAPLWGLGGTAGRCRPLPASGADGRSAGLSPFLNAGR